MPKNFVAAVDDDDYNEFAKRFPIYGANRWLITSTLRNFNKLVRQQPSLDSLVVRAIQMSLAEARGANMADLPPMTEAPSAPTH